MTVLEMLKQKIKEVGADGLCSEECGCGIDDIAPGSCLSEKCQIAWRHEDPDCAECGNGCDFDQRPSCYRPFPQKK